MSNNENSAQTPDMMTPEEAFKGVWPILGIDRTKDRLEIKRAYSALAKKTHPEEDPEGFKKLHDAYKGALVYASIPETVKEKTEEQEDELQEDPKDEEIFEFPSASLINDEEEKKEETADVPDFDFSFVDDDELTAPRMVEDAIVRFKENNGINSLSALKAMPHGNRKRLTEILFSQYCNLAIVSKDVSTWDVFFQENIVQWYLPDEGFRRFLENSFREGDPNREKLMELNRKYEESLVPEPPKAAAAAPSPYGSGYDKVPVCWLTVLQIILDLICVVLVIAPIALLGNRHIVSTRSMDQGLIGFFAAIDTMVLPLAIVVNIAAVRQRKEKKSAPSKANEKPAAARVRLSGADIVRIVLRIAVNLLCIALFAIPPIIVSTHKSVFTERMADSLTGVCAMFGIVLTPVVILIDIAAFRERRLKKGK